MIVCVLAANRKVYNQLILKYGMHANMCRYVDHEEQLRGLERNTPIILTDGHTHTERWMHGNMMEVLKERFTDIQTLWVEK